jgi:hypothetical protein
MQKFNLPLCPCGSGRLYEECCYKKKGTDGEPLFFKGAVNSNDGKVWHPIPNVRFALIIGGQEIDKYREYAKKLVTKSKLLENHRQDFINHYGLFSQAYEQLLKSFKPSGKGASFQMDTIEVRKHWKDFLFTGRILLDFIGLHSREVLGLNLDVGGLNKKKFELLLNTIKKLGTRDTRFLEIKVKLETLKNDIIVFIGFRDKEKLPQDTIVEFPTIDYEYGLIKDGKISLNDENFSMIGFIKKSYESIHKLTLILLGVGQ